MGNKNQETRDERLKFAFGSNAKVNELHVTSDDQMFTNIDDAKNHAKSLEDSEVETAKRSNYVTVQKSVDKDPDDKSDLTSLRARHLELFGKEAAKTAKAETIQEKIVQEELRLKEVAKKELLAKEQEEKSGDNSQDPEGANDPEHGKEN